MTDTGSTYHGIYGTLTHETMKAYLWVDESGREFWLPKSQCRNLYTVPNEDDRIYIEVKEWILIDKGVETKYWHDEKDEVTAGRQSVPDTNDKPLPDGFADFDDDIPF